MEKSYRIESLNLKRDIDRPGEAKWPMMTTEKAVTPSAIDEPVVGFA